jgi:septum formation protein
LSQLILASTSPWRRELLGRLKLPFEAVAPEVDEAAQQHETPVERAQRLALAKAEAVSRRFPQACVIGSDQVAVCKGEILDKPGSIERCRLQLRHLSGAAANFHSAVAIVPAAGCPAIQFIETTTVYFRTLGHDEIVRYVETEAPLDCAGGFRAEALGISLFARVLSDDPTSLIGLPLIALARALRQLGYDLP